MTSDPSTPSPPIRKGIVAVYGWACGIALLTMLLTMIPYFVGASFAGDRRYMWLSYNLDDSCVYLSWMRQAADGAWRAYNLFTTETQHGMLLNPFFLVLGRFAGWFHLSLLTVYHAARVVFGFALIMLVWALIRATIADNRAQKLALLFVCFSSGLGWLPFWWDTPPFDAPIDKWQPEAITFLSLYLSPLFCFSMALQLGILLLLFAGERTGRMRCAVGAGLLGFILALTHSYDIISLAVIWIVYLIVMWKARAGPAPSLSAAHDFRGSCARAGVAGLLTAPGVAYIFEQFRSDPVFRARAQVATLSPNLIWVLLGYGLLLALGGAALAILWRKPGTSTSAASASNAAHGRWTTGYDATILLAAWAFANIAASYIPHVAFQRKMLQGAHFPIAILAAVGACSLLNRWKRMASPVAFRSAAAVLTLVFGLTNIRFVLRDIDNYESDLAQTKLQRPYLQPGEVEALEWVQAHSPTDAAIQPLPWLGTAGNGHYGPLELTLACFTPGLIHRSVYCGHWGETPDFGKKLARIVHFGVPTTSDTERRASLREMKVQYLIFSQKSPSDTTADSLLPMFRGRLPLPPYLTLVHSNADADVYEIQTREL